MFVVNDRSKFVTMEYTFKNTFTCCSQLIKTPPFGSTGYFLDATHLVVAVVVAELVYHFH